MKNWKNYAGVNMYHVSEVYLGSNPVFIPRVPEGIDTDIECSNIPRICVAPTIEKCLMAITGDPRLESWIGKELYIYRFENVEYVRPTDEQVPDAYRTDEHWILEETIAIFDEWRIYNG
jgi:hypothetical protein